MFAIASTLLRPDRVLGADVACVVDCVLSGVQLDITLRPAFRVRVPSGGTSFGPRDGVGAQLSADDVWRLALSAFAPAEVGLVDAMGGYALFGLTSPTLQATLAAVCPPTALPSSRSAGTRTPKQGVFGCDSSARCPLPSSL